MAVETPVFWKSRLIWRTSTPQSIWKHHISSSLILLGKSYNTIAFQFFIIWFEHCDQHKTKCHNVFQYNAKWKFIFQMSSGKESKYKVCTYLKSIQLCSLYFDRTRKIFRMFPNFPFYISLYNTASIAFLPDLLANTQLNRNIISLCLHLFFISIYRMNFQHRKN